MKFTAFALAAFAAALSSSSASPVESSSGLEARSNFQVFASYDRIHNKIKKQWKAGVRLTEDPPSHDEARTPGYKFLWGPTTGASRQGNYISYIILDTYDVDACAAECGRHNRDLGVCEGFNIFRGSFSGEAVAVICTTYGNAPSKQASTFRRKGGFTVDWSRGYERTQIVPDQDFRTDEGVNWISEGDAAVVTDNGDEFDGSYAINQDATLQGSIASTPLNTVPGRPYTILLAYEARPGSSSLFTMKWNGVEFGTPIIDDPYGDKRLIAAKTPVAIGNDTLEFYGGSVDGSWAIDLVQAFVV